MLSSSLLSPQSGISACGMVLPTRGGGGGSYLSFPLVETASQMELYLLGEFYISLTTKIDDHSMHRKQANVCRIQFQPSS